MAGGLDLQMVKSVIDFAVGDTRPDLTLFLHVPPEVSAERLLSRQSILPFIRDRMEEGGPEFLRARGQRLRGHRRRRTAPRAGGGRRRPIEVVCARIWELVQPVLPRVGRW